MSRIALPVLLVWLVAASPAEAAWRWPLRGEVDRGFAVRPAQPFAAGQHRGVDLAAPPGRPVRAACSGLVSFAGRVARSGGVVTVRCGRLAATYLELGRVLVARGVRVRTGRRLGTVGAAAHLHLGARDVAAGRYVDPLTLLRVPRHGSPPSLGPAPRPAAPRPPRIAAPEMGPVPAAAPAAVPVLAWVGLGLVAAGLPLGALVVRQRSRQRTSWTSTSPSSRATSSAR